ncbi:hypothetical protein QTP88_022278 [Uroleucon formosanum]
MIIYTRHTRILPLPPPCPVFGLSDTDNRSVQRARTPTRDGDSGALVEVTIAGHTLRRTSTIIRVSVYKWRNDATNRKMIAREDLESVAAVVMVVRDILKKMP